MKQLTTKSHDRTVRHHQVPRTVALRFAQKRPLGAKAVGAFIQEMTKFRDRGDVSQEQYQKLVLLACSAYVEQEVERQIMRPLEKVLSPERLVRHLSPLH